MSILHAPTIQANGMPASFGGEQLLRTITRPEQRRIIRELAKHPRYVTELACILNVPQPTVSNQLRALRAHGLVKCSEHPAPPQQAAAIRREYCLTPGVNEAIAAVEAAAEKLRMACAATEEERRPDIA